jgi:phenylacetate-coenzyme A ligase PaaK-like adenylate-forming protein
VITSLLERTPYSIGNDEKGTLLICGLNALSEHHYRNCVPYRRIIDGLWGGKHQADCLETIPYLPVSLFKMEELRSVDQTSVRMILTSSGTTGQAVSKIPVDTETSSIQQRALAHSLAHMLGKSRLPMLVIDTDAVFKDPKMMSARGAGVLGIMRYGRQHAFALDQDLSPDFAAVEAFLARHGSEPFFMFGFTFMIWCQFYEQFRDKGLDLRNGTLIHSGGWKKLVDRSVDNAEFRSKLSESFGLTKIFNFYGMVEQLGSLFVEGPRGLLYPPNYSDVIIRCPESWEPLPPGNPGLIQVLSLIPRSYPGHSLLTEDMGVIECIDPGENGWMGKGLRILGRVPKAELRGCSDVIAAQAA